MSRPHLVLGCLVTGSLLALGVAAPAAAASSVDYVALGDSYSSGVGAPGQVGTCLRSPNGYPSQWASRNSPKSFTNLTCSGAETSDVLASQAPNIPSGTDLVSITIGGNDAGFASTVLTCQFSSDASCAKTVADAEASISATLGGKLDNTYAAIKAKAPSAQVVVLDYPLLFDTTSSSCGLTGMSLAKRKSLNGGAQVLDDLIKQHAQAAGFTFSDVRDEFAGHGICASSPYLNGLTLAPAQNSFHPNQNGYTYGYLPAFSGAVS
ncbi:SGNH/GDSL hydrolase family protein [Actinoplanes sp. KI2]|uniref:SGNH/GDSL hydrolase family protein n=1 Tax=Actinoplanes sp. KI2 TaxID=2983315 RepID=UPI0021D5C9B7|nr:SGNH/GDSL hydrolase family protein [Actinoplanes sp. KI2]MCU7725140.1 SGNH/GDSL hydrolase family protein [Actinoplanes sp. KI2]